MESNIHEQFRLFRHYWYCENGRPDEEENHGQWNWNEQEEPKWNHYRNTKD